MPTTFDAADAAICITSHLLLVTLRTVINLTKCTWIDFLYLSCIHLSSYHDTFLAQSRPNRHSWPTLFLIDFGFHQRTTLFSSLFSHISNIDAAILDYSALWVAIRTFRTSAWHRHRPERVSRAPASLVKLESVRSCSQHDRLGLIIRGGASHRPDEPQGRPKSILASECHRWPTVTRLLIKWRLSFASSCFWHWRSIGCEITQHSRRCRRTRTPDGRRSPPAKSASQARCQRKQIHRIC